MSMIKLQEQMEVLYIKKDYAKVQELLLQNRDQFSDGQFYYNYGTLFLKMGKIGPARYNFEKAIDQGWVTAGLKKNYSIVYSSVSVDPMKSDNIVDRVNASFEAVPWWGILAITLITINILLVFLTRKKLKIKQFIILVLISVFLFGGLGVYKSKLSSAIALKETPIKEGPSNIYEDVSTLPDGAKVIIERRDSGWLLISAPKQFSGWVKANDLGVLR